MGSFSAISLLVLTVAAGAATSAQTMSCDFRGVPAALDYRMQYEAGYALKLPLARVERRIGIKLQITSLPGNRESYTLSGQYNVPAAEDGSAVLLRGRFAIAPGTYQVDAVATGAAGQSCHGQWTLKAGALKTSASEPVSGRIALLVDAASADPRAVRLAPEEIEMLTGGVVSVLSRLSAESVRLVVFNIANGVEYLHSDKFTLADAGRLRELLESVSLGTIDYRNISKALDPGLYLAQLIDRETGEPDPPAKVVVVGAQNSSPAGKHAILVSHTPALLSHTPARCFYLEYRGSLLAADTIEQAMRQLHGRTLGFSNGREFANALDRVAEDH